jgi:RNA polymerase sporulation-specific sigma factor
MGRGCDIEDLFQIGCIGLIKAIDRFDLSYGVKLSTYAVPMISGEIKRFLRDSGTIKCSRSLKELNMKICSYREKAIMTTGVEPKIAEIAAALSVSGEDITLAMEASYAVRSLDSPELSECTSEAGAELVDKLLLEELLDRLPEKERQLIEYRYFMDKTQSETGRLMNLTQVQVSRLEKKIIEKLQNEIK